MIAVASTIAIARIVLIVISLGIWHWTQKLLARRNPPDESKPPPPVQQESAADFSAERARLIRELIDAEHDEREPQSPATMGARSKLVHRLLYPEGGTQEYIRDLLATMAATVRCTEAAAFAIDRTVSPAGLTDLAHIRPDQSDAATRAAALVAFRQLVGPCIAQGRDGALEVAAATGAHENPQYCLITLLRDGTNVVAVAAIIIRCATLERARLQLMRLQVVAGYFDFQHMLKRARQNVDPSQAGAISDSIHRLTARINQRLLDHPRRANVLLIASSLVIDGLGIYLLVSAIIGPTIAPFLGLFMVFGLRQICQAFCPLSPPVGMIWRKTGVPSLLVTYGTSCDLFFSGHTAIAVYGCATLAAALGPAGIAIGCAIVAFEIWTVLVLRAHYTMDVFTGAIVALYVHRLAIEYAPFVDQWIAHLTVLVR